MTSKFTDFIAVFLVQLILTIPFYTTNVYAAINKISVKGNDGIEGFAKTTDFLNFNVDVSIQNDTITNEQVVLGSNPGVSFDKCAPLIANGSECTLRFPSNGTESFEAKSIPFTINLFKDDKTLDDSSSSSVTIDNKPPQVTLSISQSKFSSQQDVVINYEITDFACDDISCNGECVGIKNIEFNTLDNTFSKTIDITTAGCKNTSTISIESKTFKDGANSVFAKAADKFNQISQEASVTFEVDVSAPEIIANSFDIKRKGISLNTFSPIKVPVEILVNISAADLDENSVIANLSSLNPSLKYVKAECTLVEDGLHVCKWLIDFEPKTAGTKTAIINASDVSGNTESVTITKTLTLDDKGPIVQSLSTTAKEGTLAKPSGNTVIAVFDEATGLSADEVFLHIGSSRITAENCNKDANWQCAWENVNFGSSNTRMSIESDTTDILANLVTEIKTTSITIDSQPPVLRSINITNVEGISPAFPGFPKIGDKIFVVANLTEEHEIIAIADFSKFVSEAKNVVGSCENIQADEHICTFDTDNINLEANDVITFNFTDSAGNSLIVPKPFKTFGLEPAEVPDFWINNVSCSPSTIDRSLGPLINQRVFCEVSLKQKSQTKSVSTVFIGLDTCSGDTSIIQNTEIFNTESGSTSPIIKLTLKKDEFKIDNATLNCPLRIFSKIGDTSDVTKNPEIENAKIIIDFFNLPLGEVSEEVQRKIDDAKKDAEGIWKLIGTLNKLVFYAKKICQIINIIYTIVSILYFTFLALKGTELVCTATVVGEVFQICNAIYGVAGGVGTATEGARFTADSLKIINNYFCDYVTCKQTILWGEPAKKWIDSLPLSKPLGGFSSKMDPQHNLVVATLFVCLPGVIYGLDKYRQVKCLYADCLQNAVGKEGLPVTACEDQKSYATCKYVTGEVFAIIPYTALFDHFTRKIKKSLSNPFTALGIAVSVACGAAVWAPREGGTAYRVCAGLRLLSLIGDAAQNVKDIIDEGFTIRQDYCSRLESKEEKKTEEPEVKTSKGTPTTEEKKK